MTIDFENIDQIRKYLPPKRKWLDVMKDDSIDIDKKILLNGLRYVYVSDMIEGIRKNVKIKKFKIYPTGSKNLSSDIDIQIVMNLTSKIDKHLLEKIVDNVVESIKKADSIWGEFPNRLDVNFYPSGLFNFVTNKHKTYPGLMMSKHDNNCCWIPILDDPELIRDFVSKDLSLVNKNYRPRLASFYKNYKQNITDYWMRLYHNYQEDVLIPSQHNKMILKLVKHNEIGPEMYFSVGSIIFVVWYIQMKNDIPPYVKKYLSISSYVENNNLYQRTGKEKYKIRRDLSKKYMDKKLAKEMGVV